MSFFISDAMAAATTAGPNAAASPLPTIFLLVGMMLFFYFLVIRPQNKRAKEHRELVAGLAKGDEVVTTGGILGKVSKLGDDFIVLSVSDNVEIKFRKNAVATTLPKGTIKSV